MERTALKARHPTPTKPRFDFYGEKIGNDSKTIESIPMIGKCCIFQPFDNGGPHDKRYKEIIEPAIVAADLEPYRVDKDHAAPIPIDALHSEIRAAVACLADISTLNPNVMYELGAAIHGEKPVVIISSGGSDTFPFDIRHRKIIQYHKDSYSDFDLLKIEITNRLLAVIKTEANIAGIVAASPVKTTHGLRPQEITVLALIMVDRDENPLSAKAIKSQMERAGYTNLASSLALSTLRRMELVTVDTIQVGMDDYYSTYSLTPTGEDWLVENQDGLELRLPSEAFSRRPPSHPQPRIAANTVEEDDVHF
jgi:hypothetical protein